jgi:hypothetical protein
MDPDFAIQRIERQEAACFPVTACPERPSAKASEFKAKHI